jgi:6-phosphogluconolactonase (cycloisomerase 2 family)
MRKLKHLIKALILIAAGSAMTACTSSSSSDGGGAGGGGGNNQPTADRFVLSGNNDGTISVFRNDSTAGYATAVAYFNAGGGFAVRDMTYDAANGHVIAITDNQIIVLGFNAAKGEVELLDQRSTSGNSSHLAVNSSGTAAYVASGASSGKSVDFYTISSSGMLSIADSTTLGVDPDYIKLDPAETRLYVVSRTDAQVLIFDLDTDHSLVSGPQVVNTGSNPTALLFNPSATTAYLTRANNSDNLVVYAVDANGDLTQTTSLSNSNSPVDMVLSQDGGHLYVLDSSNKKVNHYTIDSTTGEPTYVASTNVSFTATDLTLSPTGAFLYVGHSEDDLVSTIAVDANDGSLSPVNWVRAFSSVNAVTAIGGSGALQPAATYLLAPDDTGLSRFAIDASGMLSLEAVENTAGAMMDGEVAVDYAKGLILGAGEDATGADLLTSYLFNPLTGGTTPVDTIDATVSSQSSFQRVELGRSGRFMYVLDEDILNSANQEKGFIRTYAYAANGTITPAQVDSDQADQAPENLSLHPAGRFIYSINSFDDTISRFEINESSGTLSGGALYTPGKTGSGVGRPIDMRFHPNGRYAYVSLEDDSQLVRYVVETNGALSNPSRTTLSLNGADVEPGPIAVHPDGKYLYVGERNTSNTISVLSINANDYSLTHQSRVDAAGNPSWLSVDPQGRYLYVRFADESIQVFSINANTGNLTATGQVISAGNSGGLYPSMTLVAPLQ